MPLVQVRMKAETLQQMETVQQRVHAPSRSDALRRAIELADVITKAVALGDEIIIQGHNGKQMRLLIPGVKAG